MKTKSLSDNILLVSSKSEVITSFRGPLIQYQIVQSIDRDKSLLRRWIVFSQGKRSVLPKYLFGKLLWDELNVMERTILFHLPEVTNDLTIFLSLKALNLGVSKRDLRRRLEKSPFPELRFITRQAYLSIKGSVQFFFKQETINIRRVEKYSGYTKHYKDKGSLGLEREFYLSDVLDPYEIVSEATLLQYLTVGEFPLLGGVAHYPDDGSKKSRNGPQEISAKDAKSPSPKK